MHLQYLLKKIYIKVDPCSSHLCCSRSIVHAVLLLTHLKHPPLQLSIHLKLLITLCTLEICYKQHIIAKNFKTRDSLCMEYDIIRVEPLSNNPL